MPQDYGQAAAWWRKAAEQGVLEAHCDLGMLYAEGMGVPADATEAAKWYRQAAERGYADAQCLLGALYEHGQGVPHDDAQAVLWYSQATEQGHPYPPAPWLRSSRKGEGSAWTARIRPSGYAVWRTTPSRWQGWAGRMKPR